MSRPVVVIDTETSGLDPCVDCLLEIAAVKLDDSLAACSTFSSLIRPTCEISDASTRVHGLTAHSLANAPSIQAVLASFLAWAPEGATLAGQNVWFDAAFVSTAAKRVGAPYNFDYHVLELWSVASFVLPRVGRPLPKYDLDHLCELFSIDRDRPHNALSDATASAEVYRRLSDLLADSNEG